MTVGRCERKDCRFRAEKDIYFDHRCDYAVITGKTRLGQICKSLGIQKPTKAGALLADPALCPFYEKKRKGDKAHAEG